MTWSAEWSDRVQANREGVIHLLRSRRPAYDLGGQGSRLWAFRSDRGFNGMTLGLGGRTSGASVSVPSWRSSLGGWSAELLGDPRFLRRNWYPGQIVEHLIGFAGQREEAFEVVQVGLAHQFSGGSGSYTLEVRDLSTALSQRWASDPDEWPLFWDVPTANTLTAEDYNAGEESSLTVYSTTGFRGETSGVGVVVVDSESEQAFLHPWNGSTSTAFTSSLTLGSTFGGTRQRALPSGVRVSEGALVRGLPPYLLAKVWASTGAGTNGTWDVLPASWGVGMPGRYLDGGDMQRWGEILSPPASAFAFADQRAWNLVSTGPQENGLEWLSGELSAGACWPVVRHGRLCLRGATDPESSSSSYVARAGSPVVARITDDDIPAGGRIAWSAVGGSPTEYAQVEYLLRTQSPALSVVSSRAPRSYPAAARLEVDPSRLGWGESTWLSHLQARTALWYQGRVEEVRMPLIAPLARGLVPGDPVLLDLAVDGGRFEVDAVGYQGRGAMITRVSPDWWRLGPTQIVAALPPRRLDRWV